MTFTHLQLLSIHPLSILTEININNNNDNNIYSKENMSVIFESYSGIVKYYIIKYTFIIL